MITQEEIGYDAVLKFIGEDEDIKKPFIVDTKGFYYASQITLLFQELSKLLLEIFISAAGAYIIYKFIQKPDEQHSRQELIREIEAILKNHEEKLNKQLKRIEKSIDKFDDRDGVDIKERKARKEKEIEIITSRKKRLNVYKEKTEMLKSSTNVTRLIIELLEDEYKKRG